MKAKIILALLALVAASVAIAAWTKQSARVESARISTSFDSNGAATAVQIDASLVALVIDDADATKIKGNKDKRTVTVNLLSLPVSTANYTAAGKTVNGVQFAALLRQIVLDEATRQNIAP